MKRYLLVFAAAAIWGVSLADAASLKIIMAQWGKQGGPYCNATQGVAQACAKGLDSDGSACQIAASNAYCGDATNGWHVLKVLFSCDGLSGTAEGAEGAQVVLNCAALAKPASDAVTPSTSAGEAGFSITRDSSWRVDDDPVLWIFHANGTMEAQNRYWTGTWKREGGKYLCKFKIGSTGKTDTMVVTFAPDGRSLTATRSGQAIHKGSRVD